MNVFSESSQKMRFNLQAFVFDDGLQSILVLVAVSGCCLFPSQLAPQNLPKHHDSTRWTEALEQEIGRPIRFGTIVLLGGHKITLRVSVKSPISLSTWVLILRQHYPHPLLSTSVPRFPPVC